MPVSVCTCPASTADYASALAIELRRGSPPDVRDFLRIKFKNGTATDFQDVHVFGHHADIPFTEFIYRAEVSTDHRIHGKYLTIFPVECGSHN